jgi:hypothetical protein
VIWTCHVFGENLDSSIFAVCNDYRRSEGRDDHTGRLTELNCSGGGIRLDRTPATERDDTDATGRVTVDATVARINDVDVTVLGVNCYTARHLELVVTRATAAPKRH